MLALKGRRVATYDPPRMLAVAPRSDAGVMLLFAIVVTWSRSPCGMQVQTGDSDFTGAWGRHAGRRYGEAGVQICGD